MYNPIGRLFLDRLNPLTTTKPHFKLILPPLIQDKRRRAPEAGITAPLHYAVPQPWRHLLPRGGRLSRRQTDRHGCDSLALKLLRRQKEVTFLQLSWQASFGIVEIGRIGRGSKEKLPTTSSFWQRRSRGSKVTANVSRALWRHCFECCAGWWAATAAVLPELWNKIKTWSNCRQPQKQIWRGNCTILLIRNNLTKCTVLNYFGQPGCA